MSATDSHYSDLVAWSEGDRCFVAVSPDFARIKGMGKTKEQALTDLHDQIEAILKLFRRSGKLPPEPHDIHSLEVMIRNP